MTNIEKSIPYLPTIFFSFLFYIMYVIRVYDAYLYKFKIIIQYLVEINIIIKMSFVIIFSTVHLYYKINNSCMLYYIVYLYNKIKYCADKYYHIKDQCTLYL